MGSFTFNPAIPTSSSISGSNNTGNGRSPQVFGAPTNSAAAASGGGRGDQDSRLKNGGPVAILWDIENCPVPGEVNAEDVAGNVRMPLSLHSAFRGAVTMYGDFNHFPRKVREGCQRTGINLIDVPNTKKDASDKAILVDMFLFALDNRPPCTILLITGDVDFAPALHKLGQRGYTVVLAIPAGFVSVSLCSAGRFVWDWASVARGHGLVPAKTFQSRDSLDHSSSFQRYPIFSDESGDERFGAAAVPIPQTTRNHSYGMGVTTQSSGEWFQQGSYMMHLQEQQRSSPQMSPIQSFQWNQAQRSQSQQQQQQQQQQHPQQSFGGVSTSASAPGAETSDGNADPTSPGGQSNTSFVQPGDIAGLKRQLVKLLSLHGGRMEMLKVPPEYCKMYGRPLYLAEYGSGKLVHLIDRMRDAVCVKGEGSERKVHLTKAGNRMAGRYKKVWGSASSSKSAAKDDEQEEEEAEEEEEEDRREVNPKEESKSVVEEEFVVYMSKQLDLSSSQQEESDSASDHPEAEEELGDEVIEIQEVSGNAVEDRKEMLRQELQDLLVSFAYHIVVSDFLVLYRQRYGKDPDYAAFGAEDLEGLLDKVKDVAILKQGPGAKRILVANVGCLPRAG